MEAMGKCTDVDVELICTPDYEWRKGESYTTWPGLQSISHEIPTIRRWRFLCGQFTNPRRAIQHAKDCDLDVLHFANINHLTFPHWRGALERSSLIATASAHDVKRQKSIIYRRWEDYQLKSFYQFANALFVHSHYQADELVDFAGVERTKIHVVPHGPYHHGPVPDVERSQIREQLDLPIDCPVALFFGKIRDEKNLDGLIRALMHSAASPHLIVAGSETGYRHRSVAYYRQLAKELEVAERVTFWTDYIPDNEVAKLFYAADWVALPYSQSFTSQSGVLNVAVRYRRPVLVTPSPVLKETVESSGIGVVCSEETPEAIAEGIDRICELVRRDYAFSFGAYKEEYSWEKNAQRTIKVYRQLIEK
jgi:glycosyltransferase involved in cell wall biosynthesis